MSAKTKNTETGLMLADVAGLTAAQTADQIAAQSKVINRAFVDRGKLIYHLDNIKLRAGQTVYGMLKSRGVSEGSIHSARTVANLITALVVPGLVPEEKFDSTMTFRTARLGDLLLKGKGKAKVDATQLATILLSGDTATVGSELECLHEHGMTIAERETALKAEEAERQRLEADAAEAQKLKAAEAERLAKEQAAAAAAATEAHTVNTVNPVNPVNSDDDEETDSDTDEDEESDDSDTDDDDEESEDSDTDDDEETDEETDEDPVTEVETIIVNGPGTIAKPAAAPKASTPPPAPVFTLESVVDRINSALIDAMDFSPADMSKLVTFLRQATAELEATVQTATPVAA